MDEAARKGAAGHASDAGVGGPARSPGHSRYRLAQQLLGLIRELGLAAGHHLREQHLADQLGVSRTPVRVALRLLAERGIVEARRNQGFFLLEASEALAALEIAVPATLDQALYERLVKDRLAGRLAHSFTQSDIVARYGADRVTMHRTLALMAEDGLVARNRGHGWHFLPTLDGHVALRSSFEFRLSIEPALFLFSTFRADTAALDRSRGQHAQIADHADIASLAASAIFVVDASFHEMLAAFSGNVFALQAVQQQNRLRRLLEYNSYEDRARVKQWCLEHLAIIDATARGDLEGASQGMRDHLAQGYRVTPPIRRLAPVPPMRQSWTG